MSEIKPIIANSRDGGEVYRLLVMIHSMAGSLANQPSRNFRLSRSNSNPMFGPILTVWTNGIVDIEASTWDEGGDRYHEYSMVPVYKDAE